MNFGGDQSGAQIRARIILIRAGVRVNSSGRRGVKWEVINRGGDRVDLTARKAGRIKSALRRTETV